METELAGTKQMLGIQENQVVGGTVIPKKPRSARASDLDERPSGAGANPTIGFDDAGVPGARFENPDSRGRRSFSFMPRHTGQPWELTGAIIVHVSFLIAPIIQP